MKPWFQDNNITIYNGDALKVLLGIELKEEYCKLILKRTAQEVLNL